MFISLSFICKCKAYNHHTDCTYNSTCDQHRFNTYIIQDHSTYLKKSIAEDGCEDTFEFLQIKEKFASLRLYAAGYGDATKEVLAKYEELSKYICGHCGEPATKITMGWYYPVCDECYERDVKGGFEDIWEWYGYGSLREVADEIKNIKENYKYEEYWNTVRKEVDGESNP